MVKMSAMKGFCPLASGSKGNSIYLGTENCKILIDAGISTRALKAKLAEIAVSLDEIDAILVSHEHSDHIRGLKLLALKHGIPILANTETAKGIVEELGDCPKFKIFSTGEPFEFGDLEITPFNIPHDTLDPVAFAIRTDEGKFGFCTDLGHVTPIVRHHLRECDYILIEANHQIEMVHACSRPPIYKQRVLGRTGHLSNNDCAKLLTELAHADLKRVYLAHLSGECNSPDHALATVSEHLQRRGIKLELAVAYQEKISTPVQF